MNIDKLKELIGGSELNQLQQNVIIGFIERAKEDELKRREDRKLIEEVARVKNLFEVVLSTDEVKIYTVNGKDEWDIKYPFRSIYLDKNGKWRRVNTVASTLDTAFLNYLEYKHLSENSRFADFAIKMLEIKVEE